MFPSNNPQKITEIQSSDPQYSPVMIILPCILSECVLSEFCVYLGSDDAVGPYIPSQHLGSRQDGHRSSGIYGNRSNDVVEDALSTIEEKSVMVRFFFYI